MFGPAKDFYLPYLLAASFMSAPGGVLMAKIIMPDVIVPLEPADISRIIATAGRAEPFLTRLIGALVERLP